MKITHITLREGGGAGNAAFRLHDACLQLGFNSTIIVLFDEGGQSNTIAFDTWARRHQPIRLILWKILRVLAPKLFFNSYKTPLRIEKMPEVERADVIILHQLDRFVNVSSFLRVCKDKNVRWRCPDFRPICGQPYPQSPWPAFLWNPRELPDNFKWIFTTSHAQEIALSKFKEVVKSNSAVIPNVIKRNSTQLTKARKHLVFCSVDVSDKRKGLEMLLPIWQRYDDLPPLLVIGKGDLHPTPNAITCGFLNSEQMHEIHEASIGLITPAVAEMFGQTTVESFLGGSPVLSNPTTGALSLIQENNNGRIHDFQNHSINENYLAIKSFSTSDWDSAQISADAALKYSIRNVIDYLPT